MTVFDNVQLHHYGLEEHLQAWCAQHSEYKKLWAAYELDKGNYISRIAATNQNSGHYSLHDASHSQKIITYIELLLGEEQIKRLSATDTWLILEVAYSHDIGMYLSEDDIRTEWNSHEFHEYLIGCANHGEPDLASAAKVFVKNDCSRRTAEEALAYAHDNENDGLDSFLKISRCIKLLITDFRRKRHANVSASLINSRFNESGTIHGLPITLYKAVSLCSEAHGFEKESVFSQKINKESQGYYLDRMHPRFAAMLVRMGDLLDIENDRFNPFVVAAFGELPDSSKAHRYKHLCIDHILVTPHSIEVSSDLTPITEKGALDESNRTSIIAATYKETHHWFNMIESELKFWHEREYEFIPEGFFSMIPVLQKRDIIINGRTYDKSDILMEFAVDYGRVLSLIGSRNFYKEPLEFLRDLIQNAFDAVKKHFRFIGKQSEAGSTWLDKLHGLLYELRNYPVTLSVCEQVDGKNERIGFAVSDNGIGIPRSGLERIQRIGSSNSKKANSGLFSISGEFGIGLHSVFAVTDLLSYRTYSEEEPSKHQLEIEARERGGRIVILPDEIKPLHDRENHGTDAWFFVDKKILVELLYSSTKPNSVSFDQIFDKLKSELRKIISPNITDLKLINAGRVSELQELVTPNKTEDDVIKGLFFGCNDLACQNGECWIWKNTDKEKFNVLSIGIGADGSSVVLVVDLKNSNEALMLSHKGSRIIESPIPLKLHGLNAELHLLDRSSENTVNSAREYLLYEAIPEIKRDINRTFRQLLIYLAQENRIDELPNNNTVLLALAKHYIALADSNEDGETKRLAGSAIEAINGRLSDYEIDGYELSCSLENRVFSLEKEAFEATSIVDGDPTKHFFIRTNSLFKGIVGMHPKVLASGLLQSCDLFDDIWEEFDIDFGVSEFYALETDMANSVIKYRLGSEHIPAESNSTSLGILLREWLKQDNRPDGMLFIPALKLKDDPNNSIFKLAVKECDFLSDNEWKLFRAFIKMPSLNSAKRYDNRQDKDKEDRPLAYSNITDICPEYLDSLVDYTLENQIEENRYDIETIRQCYIALLEMLS